MLNKRSNEKELIDLGPPHYTRKEYFHCLKQLNKVGEYLGGDRATFKALKCLDFTPRSILDVGCGGGGFTQKLGQNYPNCRVTGIDIDPLALEYAQCHSKGEKVTFELTPLNRIPAKSYDIVLTTLVCHHLPDKELIPFLSDCLRVAKKGVIINDLHRHPVAWLFFRFFSPFLFKNRLITHDGSLSIKKSFIKKEWKNYLKQLNIPSKIEWYFPFRWIITLKNDLS